MSIPDGKPPTGYEVWDCESRPFKRVAVGSRMQSAWEELAQDAEAVCSRYRDGHPSANLIIVPMGSGVPTPNILNEAVRLQAAGKS